MVGPIRPKPERHLRHLLKSYQKYYNEARTHLSLQKDAPIPRAVQTVGQTLAVPILGGLHHQYIRASVSDRDRVSGSIGRRLGPVTASARSFPELIRSTTGSVVMNMISLVPFTRSAIACGNC